MRKALFQLHIAIFLAGFTAILGRLIELNEGWLVWYRLLITLLVLGPWLYFRKELKRLTLQQAWRVAGTGALVALHWVCFFGSVKQSNVSIALVCLSATGCLTAFLEPLLRKTRFEKMELLLGLLSLFGIYLIFNFNPQYKIGIILGVISSLLASLFTIRNKQLVGTMPVTQLTLYELGGGWLVLTILMPLYAYFFPGAGYWPAPGDWIWLLILALLCTVLAFYLQLQALTKLSSFTSTLLYNLEPVYGILLAFFLFQENKLFGAGFYAGVSLIILSVLLQTWRIKWQQHNKNQIK